MKYLEFLWGKLILIFVFFQYVILFDDDYSELSTQIFISVLINWFKNPAQSDLFKFKAGKFKKIIQIYTKYYPNWSEGKICW